MNTYTYFLLIKQRPIIIDTRIPNLEAKNMSAESIKELLAYNAWADQKILETARHLTEEQRQAPMPKGFSAGSLHNTLRHVLYGEWVWLHRCLGESVNPNDFPDSKLDSFADLLTMWQDEAANMAAFATSLSDDNVERKITYGRSDSAKFTNSVHEALTQVCFHGMQHRAECAAMLTEFGRSPGNIDFIWFLRERDAKK